MKVAIVVGHQESNQGAVTVSGLSEWSYNLPVANALSAILTSENKDLGISSVVMHPDVPHYQKPKLVNAEAPDLCIELHFNSADSAQATGTEVLFWKGSKKGELFSGILQKSLIVSMGLKDRGIKPIASKAERGGTILSEVKAPCVIVEPFFGSNKHDVALFTGADGVAKYARALANAIFKYAVEVKKL